jgi:hypothetical protein
MPTKDEQIEALKKENESLKEQLRYCKIAVEGKSPADTTHSGKPYTSNEPVLPKPATSEEAKQS